MTQEDKLTKTARVADKLTLFLELIGWKQFGPLNLSPISNTCLEGIASTIESSLKPASTPVDLLDRGNE